MYVAKVTFPVGTIALDTGGDELTWMAVDGSPGWDEKTRTPQSAFPQELILLRDKANFLCRPPMYYPSPQDGVYGRYAASLVARELGGAVSYAPLSPQEVTAGDEY